MPILKSKYGWLKVLALGGVALAAAGCKSDGPTIDDLYQPTAYYENHPIIVTKSGAHAKECGNWPKDLARTSQNDAYENFGCAQQNNIAAMVANPEDLIRPRRQTPSDAMRRSKIFDDYRNGSTTSGAQEEKQKVTISDVAK